MDGCLVVHKPVGFSSHDIVEQVRRAYGVKAGHGGTLDPMAQGVLLIFMGKGLKLLQYIPPDHLDKTYLMRVTLGRTTDTYDATGTTVALQEGICGATRDEIVELLRKFVGTIDQKPPSFSAIKVGGKRAYALARAGTPVDLATRKIHVTSIRLVRDFLSPGGEGSGGPLVRHLVLRVHCSRGTYVRSIAHDLGQALGCGGHLSFLLRERVGQWSHREAFPAWKIEQKHPFLATPSFMPFADILPFSRAKVTEQALAKIRCGAPLDQKDILAVEAAPAQPLPGGPLIQVFSPQGELLALYGPEPEKRQKGTPQLVPVRVLS